jgi:hypothetical protein
MQEVDAFGESFIGTNGKASESGEWLECLTASQKWAGN